MWDQGRCGMGNGAHFPAGKWCGVLEMAQTEHPRMYWETSRVILGHQYQAWRGERVHWVPGRKHAGSPEGKSSRRWACRFCPLGLPVEQVRWWRRCGSVHPGLTGWGSQGRLEGVRVRWWRRCGSVHPGPTGCGSQGRLEGGWVQVCRVRRGHGYVRGNPPWYSYLRVDTWCKTGTGWRRSPAGGLNSWHMGDIPGFCGQWWS